jgi:hypothetical protein
MSLLKIAAMSFADEMNKIAEELDMPINGLRVDEAMQVLEGSFLDNMFKTAVTRAVKEWRRASGAGDTATADAIAQGYGQLGAKPRYLEDISIGGAEAGVDKMMGDVRHSTGQMPVADPIAPQRALDQRLEQMKANKAQLGLEGRLPTPSVKQSPEGRAALLRGTQPGSPVGAAPNESGYIARKMYKPDSFISQGEFTPQHVQQKMEMTQAARALSPEAKAMVPDMYGMQTHHSGPQQRTLSYHEYVPGMKDLRGKNIGTEDKPIFSNQQQASKDLSAIKEKVISPLAAKGMTMGDVTAERGTNWGNIARDAKGQAKVVDFLPQMSGGQSPAMKSFMKYAPMPTLRHSEEGGGSLGDLRKEMYKPTMESRPASPAQVHRALKAHGAVAGPTPAPDPFPSPKLPASPPAAPAGLAGASTSMAKTSPAAPGALSAARTGAATPGALRPVATSAAAPGALRKITTGLRGLHP